MIPLRDTIPSHRTAWVVRLLLLVNLVVFALEVLQGPRLEAWIYRYGVVPSVWMEGWDTSQLAALVSSQFLHGGLLHLGSNMLYLWIFGDNVEDRFGHVRFLLLYLGSGILAAVAQTMADPHSSVPMIGASGAIAGILGAYFILFPYARVVTLVPWVFVWDVVELPAFAFLGFWFVLQWLQGFTDVGRMAEVGGVAWWAHVGGFVAGMGLTLLARPKRR